MSFVEWLSSSRARSYYVWSVFIAFRLSFVGRFAFFGVSEVFTILAIAMASNGIR